MTEAKRSTASKFIVASALYYAALCVLSHMPQKNLAIWTPTVWDKGAHFVVFLVLGTLLALGLVRLMGSHKRTAVLLITSSVILALGSLDEFHQSFVPGREMSVGDAVADFTGGTVGALGALFGLGIQSDQRSGPPELSK